VPCTLLSFEKEQIIVCKKRLALVENVQPTQETEKEVEDSFAGDISAAGAENVVDLEIEREVEVSVDEDILAASAQSTGDLESEREVGVSIDGDISIGGEETTVILEIEREVSVLVDGDISTGSGETTVISDSKKEVENSAGGDNGTGYGETTVDFEALWQRALDEGQALQLDEQIADPDLVFEKAAELSVTFDEPDSDDLSSDQEEKIPEEDKGSSEVPSTSPFDVPPVGGLAVDDLAKLLAP
jgi:hypothetical protein